MSKLKRKKRGESKCVIFELANVVIGVQTPILILYEDKQEVTQLRN